MTNKKITRKALLMSMLSLLLCFSMLVGTTFAWFTDSVTSSNNVIKAGNLDIKLEYLTDNGWQDVDGASDILTNELWEPGVVEVAYLRVENAGSLALKYKLGVNIISEIDGVNKAGESFKLSDYIKFGVVEGVNGETGKYATREEAVAAVANAKKISAGYTKASYMTEGEEMYLALVVWMPTDVTNEANHNGTNVPVINLGIDVKAEQLAKEEDSFNKYYDGATPWLGGVDTSWYNDVDTEFVIGTAEELAGLAELVNTCVDSFAGKTIKLASNIDLNNINWTPIGDVDADDYVGFNGTFDGQGYTINNLKITSNSWGQGLFGYMANNVTVQNVNINNVDIVADCMSGTIFGVSYKGTFTNIHVFGDVSIIGTSAVEGEGYIGGIIGHTYYANFENCSVVSNGGTIKSAAGFVGGIVGYQCDKTKTFKDCSVEGLTITGYVAVGGITGLIQAGGNAIDNCTVKNVVLNMIRSEGNPAIGAFVGSYTGTAATTLTGEIDDVTLNGAHIPYAAFNELYGSNYEGATTPNFDVSGVTGANTITNNLVEVNAATPTTLQDMINNAAAGTSIVLTAGNYTETIVMKSGITLYGSASAIVSCINLNGADNVTLKNITFDAATAKTACDGAGNVKIYANIISGDNVNKPIKGAFNLVIDGCTFTGTYANGGAAIAFTDQKRSGGFSGNVTIKNCTFDTVNAYYDIYGYYTGNSLNGYGDFAIMNNTFKTVHTQAGPIYLGRYASSTPVVLKGNTFETVASLSEAMGIQDHSSYGVSINASNNTYLG